MEDMDSRGLVEEENVSAGSNPNISCFSTNFHFTRGKCFNQRILSRYPGGPYI